MNMINVQGINHEYLKIDNCLVYNLENSMRASGYPMSVDVNSNKIEPFEKTVLRAEKLGHAKPSSGHDCYLKGIMVSFDVTFPQYIWQQAKRYHWFDFVSSTSTMHRIAKMEITKQCTPMVCLQVMGVLEHAVADFNMCDEYDEDDWKSLSSDYSFTYGVNVTCKEDLFSFIVENIPSGLMLTAQITTNYLQLKTMYNQRKNHKMISWRLFCEYLLTMPMFHQLILKKS